MNIGQDFARLFRPLPPNNLVLCSLGCLLFNFSALAHKKSKSRCFPGGTVISAVLQNYTRIQQKSKDIVFYFLLAVRQFSYDRIYFDFRLKDAFQLG